MINSVNVCNNNNNINNNAATVAGNLLNIPEDRAGQRLDNFLLSKFKKISRPRIYRLLRTGEIRVNKGRVKPNYRVSSGDVVRLPPQLTEQLGKAKTAAGAIAGALEVFAASAAVSAQPTQTGQTSQQSQAKSQHNLAARRAKAEQIFQAALLYEDEQLIILNKPAGLAVHGGSGLSYGVIELLRDYWPQLQQLELVHRLDRETSGCLLVAKKRSMLRELHRLLRERKIHKIYHALLKGELAVDRQVNLPLKKYELNSGKRLVKVDMVAGAPALTKFIPLQNFAGQATLVEAQPITGKTHQIRVHAAELGLAIAGDDRYGDNQFNLAMKRLGLKRLFLHAERLEFTCPKTGKLIAVTAPYDQALLQVMHNLRDQS